MHKSKKHTTRGLTLIEAIIMLVVFTTALLALSSSVAYFYQSNRITLEQSLALGSARRGVEFMVRDIREATYSEEGSFPIESIGPYSITFYSDTDRDDSVERMRYSINGSSLEKGVVNPSGDPLTYSTSTESVTTLSEYVRNIDQGVSAFTYFDSTGAEITDYGNITDVAFVKVNLIVNVNPDRFPGEFTLRSSATIRNLKTNL